MSNKINIPSAGSPIDLAPFGRIKYFYGTEPLKLEFPDAAVDNGAYLPSEPDDEDRRHLGLWFDDPRDIYSVAVTFEPGTIPETEEMQVQYWQRNWPFDDRDLSRGAGRGWIGRDDHYRGKWVEAISDIKVDGDTVVYDFYHLDITEMWNLGKLNNAEDYNAEYRCALKFRLLFPANIAPRVRKIEAFTKGEWKAGEVDVFGVGDAEIEAYNGYVTSMDRKGDVLNIKYLYVPTPADDFPHRRTVFTVKDAQHPFSFCASDTAEKPLYIEDFGVLVRPAGDIREPKAIIEQLKSSGIPTIYDRVFTEPEQTFERAMAEIPRMRAPFQHHPWGRYVPLGCEGNRQHFCLRFNANVFMDKDSNKPRGKDLVNLLWPAHWMSYRFASGDFPNFREYENACQQSWDSEGAPVVTSVWVDRDIEYTQTAFAAYLREDMGEYFSKRGDEDLVLLLQFEIRNIAHDARKAHLWMQSAPFESVEYSNSVFSANGRLIRTEALQSDELAARMDVKVDPQSFNWVERPYDKSLIRCRIDLGKGCGFVTPLALDREAPAGIPTAFHYQADLKGGERDVVTFVVPYCTLTGDDGMQLLGSVDYNTKLKNVKDFWVPFVESSAKISIPDKMIEQFYCKVPVHVAITATKDPKSGEYTVPAGTYSYGACGNEACLQIRQLDYRGFHKQAEKYLNGMLVTQGLYTLDGNFKDPAGALMGMEIYNGKPVGQPFSYNTDHGFMHWTLCEHYFLTRDKEWLKRVADNLIAASDYVIRERQATKVEDNGERVPHYGLMPCGHLEDNDEWRYWYAVNGHAYLGIKWSAEALAEIDHPEAARLAREAEEFKSDILASLERTRVESPVVTLFDNTAVPHLPARTDIRGPEWGWFREGAYGPMHLIDGHVLDPNDQRSTWIMKYAEDLVYPSRDSGRPIDLEKKWFSQAGLTIQANLLNNGVAYIRRDEPKHAVRAMFNDFAASIYSDVLIFTEHPVIQLSRGQGPYFKTPDECGFLNTLRMCMAIEEGDTLYLAKAAPVSWFKPGETVEFKNQATWFGNTSYSISVSEDAIEALIKTPRRNPPAKLAIRLRRADGKAIREVTVNGKSAEFDAEKELLWLDPSVEEIKVMARS